jgi:TetR/AcrR family transcriptional repressor of nem operon
MGAGVTVSKFEQKEQSHQTILVSAAQLLRHRGIAGARVADVMSGAGLTVGGFYAHFASKTELVDETLRETASALRARLFERIEEKPPADRAEVILRRYLSPAHRDLKTEGCPLPAVVGEIGTTAPEHGPVLRELIDAMATELSTHLSGARPVPRRHLALALVALMYGGLSLSRALKGTDLSDELLRACRAVGVLAARSEEAKAQPEQ